LSNSLLDDLLCAGAAPLRPPRLPANTSRAAVHIDVHIATLASATTFALPSQCTPGGALGHGGPGSGSSAFDGE